MWQVAGEIFEFSNHSGRRNEDPESIEIDRKRIPAPWLE